MARSACSIAGKPVPRFFYNGLKIAEGAGHYGLFAEKGVHLLSINADFVSSQVWKARGQYDFAVLERAIKRVLAVDPQARIILGIWADTYPAWSVENPDEVCANTAGLKAIGDAHFKKWGTDPGKLRFLPSVFSTKAQHDDRRNACQRLTSGRTRTNSARRSSAIIFGDSMTRTSGTGSIRLPPAGKRTWMTTRPPRRRRFSAWLKKKYGEDPAGAEPRVGHGRPCRSRPSRFPRPNAAA